MSFGSRIQVALPYPAPDPASRRRIWQNFLNVLVSEDERVDLDGITARMEDLARREMNGWQIRNAITTARRLAASEKAAIAWAHLEPAISVVPETTRFPHNEHDNVLTDFDFDSFLAVER